MSCLYTTNHCKTLSKIVNINAGMNLYQIDGVSRCHNCTASFRSGWKLSILIYGSNRYGINAVHKPIVRAIVTEKRTTITSGENIYWTQSISTLRKKWMLLSNESETCFFINMIYRVYKKRRTLEISLFLIFQCAITAKPLNACMKYCQLRAYILSYIHLLKHHRSSKYASVVHYT